MNRQKGNETFYFLILLFLTENMVLHMRGRTIKSIIMVALLSFSLFVVAVSRANQENIDNISDTTSIYSTPRYNTASSNATLLHTAFGKLMELGAELLDKIDISDIGDDGFIRFTKVTYDIVDDTFRVTGIQREEYADLERTYDFLMIEEINESLRMDMANRIVTTLETLLQEGKYEEILLYLRPGDIYKLMRWITKDVVVSIVKRMFDNAIMPNIVKDGDYVFLYPFYVSDTTIRIITRMEFIVFGYLDFLYKETNNNEYKELVTAFNKTVWTLYYEDEKHIKDMVDYDLSSHSVTSYTYIYTPVFLMQLFEDAGFSSFIDLQRMRETNPILRDIVLVFEQSIYDAFGGDAYSQMAYILNNYSRGTALSASFYLVSLDFIRAGMMSSYSKDLIDIIEQYISDTYGVLTNPSDYLVSKDNISVQVGSEYANETDVFPGEALIDNHTDERCYWFNGTHKIHTYWLSRYDSDEIIFVLPYPVVITSLEIKNLPNGTANISIYFSDDGTNWRYIRNYTLSRDGIKETIEIEPREAKYIRINALDHYDSLGITEIDIRYRIVHYYYDLTLRYLLSSIRIYADLYNIEKLDLFGQYLEKIFRTLDFSAGCPNMIVHDPYRREIYGYRATEKVLYVLRNMLFTILTGIYPMQAPDWFKPLFRIWYPEKELEFGVLRSGNTFRIGLRGIDPDTPYIGVFTSDNTPYLAYDFENRYLFTLHEKEIDFIVKYTSEGPSVPLLTGFEKEIEKITLFDVSLDTYFSVKYDADESMGFFFYVPENLDLKWAINRDGELVNIVQSEDRYIVMAESGINRELFLSFDTVSVWIETTSKKIWGFTLYTFIVHVKAEYTWATERIWLARVGLFLQRGEKEIKVWVFDAFKLSAGEEKVFRIRIFVRHFEPQKIKVDIFAQYPYGFTRDPVSSCTKDFTVDFTMVLGYIILFSIVLLFAIGYASRKQ